MKVIAYYPGTGTYLLRTTSIVTTAETEQNNFINSADGPFTADTWIRAPLDTTVDRDYFALRNATAAPVTVHLETFVGGIGLCRGGGTDLYVEAADGTVLAFNDNASNDSWCSALDYTIPADTTVYARVANDYVEAITEYLSESTSRRAAPGASRWTGSDHGLAPSRASCPRFVAPCLPRP